MQRKTVPEEHPLERPKPLLKVEDSWTLLEARKLHSCLPDRQENHDAPQPVMQRAATTLHHSMRKPQLSRLNAGKIVSRSCNHMTDMDSGDWTFLVLPGPKSLEEMSRPWEEPGVAEYHEELLQGLPELQKKVRGGSAKEASEAATLLRELGHGSPQTVRSVYEAGMFQLLTNLMESEDPATVEETVMAVVHFAQHKDARKRLVESGIMTALSLALIRAAERKPRPHLSIQSNICAAYLELSGGSLRQLGSAVIFASSSLLKNVLRLARPCSGCDFDGRRDALKLVLLLCDRGDVRGKLVDYGALEVAIENIEAQEKDLFEEVGALLHAFSKMDEAGRQLCGMLPLPNKLGSSPSAACASPEAPSSPPSSSIPCTPKSPSSPGPITPGRRSGGRRSGWNPPDIAEDEVLVCQLQMDDAKLHLGCRGLAAVVRLLSLDCTTLTQEVALSIVTRLVTRGLLQMTQAVREQRGMMEALERIHIRGTARGQKKAFALMETLKKVCHDNRQEGSHGALQ